jgi:hypothetical protein
MIKVFSTQYLAENPENKNELFVITIKDTFFLGMKIRHEEHCNYDLALIERYKIQQPQPKAKKIGFKTNANTKKSKKNGNKSKVSQS